MRRHMNATSFGLCTPAPRRGSVLIMVVALLVLMAMIGTAYIATVRIDRYGSRIHVEQVEDEVIRGQFLEEVVAQVVRAIQEDATAPVTSPKVQHWLGDRVPQRLPIPTSDIPMWENISGAIMNELLQPAPGGGPNSGRFRSPWRPNAAFDNRYNLAVADRDASAVPTQIPIRYPDDHPDERLAGRTRVFPGLQFLEWPSATSVALHPANPGPYLAGDADGDGIADAAMWQLNDVPIKGVTYYATVRIIDHGSAININTARSMETDFTVTGSSEEGVAGTNFAMFPSNIGLQEMLHDPTLAGPDPDHVIRQMRDLNFFRFGFDDNGIWQQQWETRVVAGLQPREDPQLFFNNFDPLPRGDFDFISQADAHYMQLGRRLGEPGYNRHPHYTPPLQEYHRFHGRTPQQGDPFPYRVFDMENTAAFAYRFLMANPNQPATEAEAALTLSAYESAANYAASSTNLGVPYFPANQHVAWFQHLNYLAGPTYSEGPATGQFLSIRPLLTTSSPVITRAPQVSNGIYDWTRDDQADTDLLHPGMLTNNPGFRTDQPDEYWRANVNYNIGDFVRDPNPPTGNGLTYIRMRWSPTVSATTNPQPSSDLDRRYWEPQPAVSGTRATSMNTAGFAEIWRSFRILMGHEANWAATPTQLQIDDAQWEEDTYWTGTSYADRSTRLNPYLGSEFDATTFAPTGEIHPLHMFRSSIRDHADPPTASDARFFPSQMMALRSAIAAVNMLHLRQMDPAADINAEPATQRTIPLYQSVPTSDPNVYRMEPEYEITIYAVRHPFITEVFAHTDMDTDYSAAEDGTGINLNGYIAIELHNPYDQPIELASYQVGIIARQRPAVVARYPRRTVTAVSGAGLAGAPAIPPGGYIVLHNLDTGTGDAAQIIPPSAGTVPADPNQPPAYYVENLHEAFDHELVLLRPPDPSNPPVDLHDYVPVDSFDFTGLSAPTMGEAHVWHYVRANDGAAIPSKAWHFVYPGRYDGLQTERRHQGTQWAEWVPASYPASGGWDPWWDTTADPNRDNPDFAPPPVTISLGGPDAEASYEVDPATGTVRPGYTFPIPLFRAEWRDNPLASTGNEFPFGAFARNGDILQVPYIGAYRVRRLNPTNPPPGNPDPGSPHPNPAEFVELNSVTMDAIFAEDSYLDNNTIENVGRFAPLEPDSFDYTYEWAIRIFEFFTVQNPHDDYLPNIDPERYYRITGGLYPQPVPNRPLGNNEFPNMGLEDNVAVQGRININTAPESVLRMLPLIANAGGTVDVNASHALAETIATYRRDTNNAAFSSLFDLNRINDFRNATISGLTVPPGYEQSFYMLNRMSNLLTTKSDAFTCYVLVQGWRNVNTSYPALDWEQRVAFIIERKADGEMTRVRIPTQ
jgi:hypothetical protein